MFAPSLWPDPKLHLLDAGHTIMVAVIDEPTIGIDTPEDCRSFVERCRSR